MDNTTKQKLLNARKLLQQNAPSVYARFTALRLYKDKGTLHELGDKEADSKPQPLA